jgi:hypothetical protein
MSVRRKSRPGSFLKSGPAARGKVTPLCALLVIVAAAALAGKANSQGLTLELPDTSLAVTYERAAVQNVLAAVNPKVFFGYFSVCADGHGFGYGNTYPSLDGHQMTDALLWLDQVRVVEANWDYVKSFQRSDGLLPLAIFPGLVGKDIGPKGLPGIVSANGGLYVHWVPGNPLEGLGGPTYIQNADVIYRTTLDSAWLRAQIPSINLAADYLGSLTTEPGAVRGGGYYVERPARLESDGVTQCYAVDAFRRVAGLNRIAGNDSAAARYERLAERVQRHFVTVFWVGDHFAEYINPVHGLVAGHGLTDVDWAAIATGIATPEQEAVLWPQIRTEERFHYGGIPTGIATHPEKYEAWEFVYDRHDLAAMGRVWYLEAWARAREGDAGGLLAGLRKISQVGRDSGYYWHERFEPDGKGGAVATGPNTYCEYPANYIRIMQRFLLGVDLQMDGSILLAPTVTGEFWDRGFGQTLRWRDRTMHYRMTRDSVGGTYSGRTPQRLLVHLPPGSDTFEFTTAIAGRAVHAVESGRNPFVLKGVLVAVTLPAMPAGEACAFSIVRSGSQHSIELLPEPQYTPGKHRDTHQQE